MAKAPKGSIWTGVLETSQSSTVVIRDDSLPEASPGRLYLYNCEREQIIEYVESIVSTKLRDLNELEQAKLGPEFEKQYAACRKAFLKEMGGRSSSYKLQSEDLPVKSTPEKAVLEVIETEVVEDLSADDDWDTVDDEDMD